MRKARPKIEMTEQNFLVCLTHLTLVGLACRFLLGRRFCNASFVYPGWTKFWLRRKM